ncbi:hypothetical protein GF366_03560 [Candidatus Peregrinibacteria bacterium]|nr:hypothetical protein [Candidatus Peregrinibacteria bacterium]
MAEKTSPDSPKLEVPKTSEEKKASMIGNKGILIAIILGIIAVIIGISTLRSLGSKEQYQGFIKKAEEVVEEAEVPQEETPMGEVTEPPSTYDILPLPVSTMDIAENSR